MKAVVLLGLLAATPALAQDGATRSPGDAIKLALAQCVDHSRSVLKIEEKFGGELEAKGFKYQRTPPDFLESTRSSTLGIAQYAHALSSSGEIWAIGYDGAAGGCMVAALATPTKDAETALNEYFAEGKKWRSERPTIKVAAGARALRWVWNPSRTVRMAATATLRDEDNVTTVTISRENN